MSTRCHARPTYYCCVDFSPTIRKKRASRRKYIPKCSIVVLCYVVWAATMRAKDTRHLERKIRLKTPLITNPLGSRRQRQRKKSLRLSPMHACDVKCIQVLFWICLIFICFLLLLGRSRLLYETLSYHSIDYRLQSNATRHTKAIWLPLMTRRPAWDRVVAAACMSARLKGAKTLDLCALMCVIDQLMNKRTWSERRRVDSREKKMSSKKDKNNNGR